MKANSVRLALLWELRLSKPPSETAFETADVPPRLLALLAGGLATAVAVVLIALAIGFPIALKVTPRGPLQPLPPAPTLQTAPELDLARYKAAEEANLGSYRLQADGHVQVPIRVAIRAEAARGWGNQQ